MLEINLNGRIPSKKNSRITNRKTGRSFPSKKYSEWHEDASSQVLGLKPETPINQTTCVSLHFIFGDKRRTDLSNKTESVNDLLVDNEILEDDNYFVIPKLVITGEYQKGVYGCRITIE